MIGQKFGRLTVDSLAYVGARYAKFWNCTCECGNTHVVRGDKLKNGNTKSCGCLGAETKTSAHIKAKLDRRKVTRRIYDRIKARCEGTTSVDTSLFTAKGYSMAPEWIASWEQFFNDMGPKPNGMTLCLVPNATEFNKHNCYWGQVDRNNELHLVLIRQRDVKQSTPAETDVHELWIRRALRNPARKSLTASDLRPLLVTTCPLLGVALSYEVYSGNTPKNYATLDRIDSTKGYEPSNIHIVSHRANALKSDATLSEMKKLIRAWERIVSSRP